jgi:RimJ/RimL family protein N-acetyltransferase
MRVRLVTDHLVLREFTSDDLDFLVELDSDPEVMRYITGGMPTPRELIQEEVLPRFLKSYEPDDGFGVWAALEKATGDLVGRMSLELDPHAERREARLGFRFLRSAWGRGYATEGSRALIGKGFSELGLERILATAYEHNAASRRVMEKSGMVLLRRFRPTQEDLASRASSSVAQTIVWEGDEVEYVAERSHWQLRHGNSRADGQVT